MHAEMQTPPAHTREATCAELHPRSHAPQCMTCVATSVSQPLEASPSQSAIDPEQGSDPPAPLVALETLELGPLVADEPPPPLPTVPPPAPPVAVAPAPPVAAAVVVPDSAPNSTPSTPVNALHAPAAAVIPRTTT